MCDTILSQLVLPGNKSEGKKVTIYPGSTKSFKGKVSSVDHKNGNAIIEINGGTMPVPLNVTAREDW